MTGFPADMYTEKGVLENDWALILLQVKINNAVTIILVIKRCLEVYRKLHPVVDGYFYTRFKRNNTQVKAEF